MDPAAQFMQAPLAVHGPNPHPGGRDIAVGDIHGFFEKLEAELEGIGFDPALDRLFCVGDLVDRGPQSKDVLAWLAKPWLKSICGNHEFMAFCSALGHPCSIPHAKHGGEWLGELPKAERVEIGRALASLPVAMEVQTALGMVGLVHADCPFDDWEGMRSADWGQRGIGNAYDMCLWSDARHRANYAGVVRNIRAVIHGHVVVKAHKILGNVHFIDTGAWLPGGKFTFLDLATLATAKPRPQR